jgi:hypothetical protein
MSAETFLWEFQRQYAFWGTLVGWIAVPFAFKFFLEEVEARKGA